MSSSARPFPACAGNGRAKRRTGSGAAGPSGGAGAAPPRGILSLSLSLLFLLLIAAPADAARLPLREPPPYKEFEIYGEKIFTLDDCSVTGDFSRFASENIQSAPGFRYASQLRLTLDGNLARHIRVNASIDDTALDREERRFTVGIDGRNFTTTLGDFQTSFSDTEFTLHNKKLKGIEFYGRLPDRGDVTFLVSRSEGVSATENFVGAGMQSEFLLQRSPVVKSSETVKLDGAPLKRGTDYTIDYEAGSFALAARLLPLEARNRVTVEYEYYPEGSAYRRTLLGTRLRGWLSPTRHVGVTLLSDADEKGSPDGDDDPADDPRPTALRVAGVDFGFDAPGGVEVAGEYALSSNDPDTLTRTGGVRSGHAGRVTAAARDEKYDIKLIRTEMDPKFDSVGRQRLSLDRALTDATLRLTPVKRLTLDLSGALGRSTELGDPDLPESAARRLAVERESGSAQAAWSFGPDSRLAALVRRRVKENPGERLHFMETLREASAARPFGAWKGTLRVNTRDVERLFDAATDRFETQVEAGVSGPFAGKGTLSLNASTLSTESGDTRAPLSDVGNVAIALTANPSPRLFASGAVSGRREENRVDRRTDNLAAGDLTLQYNPSERVQTQARLREVHSRQFVVQRHETVERLLTEAEREKETILRVDEPIATATGSFLVTWTPSGTTSVLAQLQFKDIENLASRRKMAVSDSLMLEAKTSPRRDLAVVARSSFATNEQNAGEEYETRSGLHGLEVRKGMRRGVTLAGLYDLETIRDSFNRLIERDEHRRTLKAERAVSRALTLHAGLADSAITRFAPRRATTALTWLGGFAYTPEGSRLTARANVERGTERDLGVDRTKSSVDSLVNFAIDPDTLVESNYRFIVRDKNDVDEGYRARVGKVTLTKRF